MTTKSLLPSRYFILAIVFFVIVDVSHAAIPGLPESTLRYGFSVGTLSMGVDDPEGLDPDSQSVVPINLMLTDWLPDGKRYWLDLVFSEAAYASATNKIGQNVRYTSLRALIQKDIKLIPKIIPWVGVGLEMSQTKYNTRHTKASDGFLLEKFEDRSLVNLGLVLNLTSDWELKNNWFLGFKMEQVFNPENNINARSMSAYFLYTL